MTMKRLVGRLPMSKLQPRAARHLPKRESRSVPPESPRRVADRLGRLHLSRYSGLGIWAAFIILYAIWVPDTFLTATTVKAIGTGQAVTAVLALAALFPLAAGSFDLSIAQNMGFGAVLAGALMTWSHVATVPAIAITLASGIGIGCLNGYLVAFVGVNSFIATLGMTSILLSVTEAIGGGQYLGPFPRGFEAITGHSVAGVPIIIVYVFVLAAIVWYVLEHTPVGRRTFATGANTEAARLAGVRTRQYLFGSFVVCGFGASLAGVLLASQLGTVDQTIGPPYLLPAFAACFLGTTQLKVGRFNVWGTILALYLLATGVEGLQLAGLQLWITDLFNGVALIGAVSVAVISERRRVIRQTAVTALASRPDSGNGSPE
jgi:ribose transport system permease protein